MWPHQTAQVFVGCGIVLLFLGEIGRQAAILGIVLSVIFGFAFRQAVCPACNKILLPKNPFDDSEP